MTEKNKTDQLLAGSHDNIQEYDNALPRWWVYLFHITIVFAIVYPVYRHAGFAPDEELVLASRLEEITKQKMEAEKANAVKGQLSDIELVALSKNDATVSAGKEIYMTRCMPCHGINGEGIVGPNLTDNHWIHGGKPAEIRHTISEGVPEKGMITWKAILSDEEMNNVTAYVLTLQGTNPPNAKAPEGIPAA